MAMQAAVMKTALKFGKFLKYFSDYSFQRLFIIDELKSYYENTGSFPLIEIKTKIAAFIEKNVRHICTETWIGAALNNLYFTSSP